MKKTLILLAILTSFVASAQSIEISPNGGTTNSSAILDLKSTTKGFLLPRMTNAQMRAIPSPAQGLLAYCTDCSTNGDYYFYKGTAWVALGSTTVSVSATVGPVGASASENGATTTNGVLNLAPADGDNPGIVTKNAQTFKGAKTFSSAPVLSTATASKALFTDANKNIVSNEITGTGNVVMSNAPAFTGTVSGIDKTMVGLANVDNTTDLLKPISSATSTALANKVDKATGERLINAAEITKLGNQSGTNTGDQDLSSLATNSNLALKANIASPTFTGTVSGITKSMIDLANVDNTSDANKPVSTATQTALNLKANLTSPTLVTPNLGTPSAAVLTNATGLPLTKGVTEILPIANGGTGSSSQNFVDLSTAQTIVGAKTFSTDLTVNGLTVGKGTAGIATNTAIGVRALEINTTGSDNTAVGLSTLQSNTEGNYNTAIGKSALSLNNIGFFNTAIGRSALSSNTRGSFNTANGADALTGSTTGSANTAIGGYALFLNQTGSSNTAIGYSADVASGALSNATAIGNGAIVNTSNKIQLGNGEVTAVQLGTGTKVTLETGFLKITGGTLGAGKVLTSDAAGLASWATPSSGVDLTTAQTIAGVKTFSVAPVLSSTTASKALFTDANKNIVSNEITGSGNVVMSNAPAFTGTVSGITKSMIDLANVDNTSDANKPVSTATSTALANKVDKVAGERLINAAEITKLGNQSGTNTGDQTLPTLSSLGAVASNAAITGATNTKITYDAKGLVTAGTAATTADIAESTDKKYVTDAQLTKINNMLGSNTGDNAVNSLYSGLVTNATHTGDVTGSTTLAIANDAVTTAKIAAGAITDSKVTDVAASKITGTLPVSKGGTGASTLAANNVLLGNGTSALQAVAPGANGNVLTSNGTTWTSAAASAVAAAAGTLTGTTLASTVVSSNLTSVGTLTSATVSGKVIVGASSATATSAVLEANSTTQGFLPPKMTFAQRNLINNPVQGLMIYCTDCNINGELQIYNGSKTWTNMIGGTANGVVSLSIGQSYQGGIVAYILQSGDPGYDSNVQHGLIAATADISPGIKWQNRTVIDTGAYGTLLGTGLSNTNKITTIQGEITTDYAAGVASALTDWCLPSKEELAKLYEMKLLGFGSFTNESYWSSSQDRINFSDFAWSLDFSNGTLGKRATYVQYRVRAIRYF